MLNDAELTLLVSEVLYPWNMLHRGRIYNANIPQLHPQRDHLQGERIRGMYLGASLQGLPLKGAVFDSPTFIKKWIEIKQHLLSKCINC